MIELVDLADIVVRDIPADRNTELLNNVHHSHSSALHTVLSQTDDRQTDNVHCMHRSCIKNNAIVIHRVSKNKQNYFCYNYVKLPR